MSVYHVSILILCCAFCTVFGFQVKHAMGCLVSFLSDISNDSEQQKLLTASLLTVFSDHQKVDRVTISFFKMINQLLANTVFVKFIVENK